MHFFGYHEAIISNVSKGKTRVRNIATVTGIFYNRIYDWATYRLSDIRKL